MLLLSLFFDYNIGSSTTFCWFPSLYQCRAFASCWTCLARKELLSSTRADLQPSRFHFPWTRPWLPPPLASVTEHCDWQDRDSDHLNYAALNFRSKPKRNPARASNSEREPGVIYAATRWTGASAGIAFHCRWIWLTNACKSCSELRRAHDDLVWYASHLGLCFRDRQTWHIRPTLLLYCDRVSVFLGSKIMNKEPVVK